MKKINTAIGYVVSVHLLALFFMFIGRLVLLIANFQYLEPIETKISWTAHAFLLGLWFDNVIVSYISILPLVVLLIAGLFNKIGKKIFRLFYFYYLVVYALAFGICIANTPYFSYFFKPINSSIFHWSEEATTNSSMILQEVSYYIYFLLFILLILLFGFIVLQINRKLLSRPQKNISGIDYLKYIPVSLILVVSCLLGIRGRLGYNPIRTSQAYFTNNSFINQLGINPAFYLMRDIYESSKSYYDPDRLMSEEDAIAFVRKELNISGSTDQSPIVREVIPQGSSKNFNVVIVLMESMSADLLSLQSEGKLLMPYLNKLADNSYYFENFFSAGIHTNHGILATLYGMPSLLDRNMMKSIHIPLCQGIPNTLMEQGYKTMFFVSHESQYDNINAFVLENGIEEVYSQESYPISKRVNSWGVADDYLFEFALNKFNEKAKKNEPFFATILTTSNHPPYVVPEKFQQVSDEPQQQILAFADDAIRQFITGAAKQEWYKNTLFVFIGDHGKLVGTQNFDMPLSYNHIPLIIHSPLLKDPPKRFKDFGGQTDVFPTIMGLLNRPYINNTLGVDIFKEKRPYMFFSSDDAIGCIDSTYFYNYNLKTNLESLYKYRENNPQNEVFILRSKADSMRTYSAAMLRTSSYMFKNNKTRVE